MQERIMYDDLPKSFQDAVTIVQGLGVRYLWINWICIIQDVQKDWRAESSKMAAVYSNSYCAIAATAAKSDDEALFL